MLKERCCGIKAQLFIAKTIKKGVFEVCMITEFILIWCVVKYKIQNPRWLGEPLLSSISAAKTKQPHPVVKLFYLTNKLIMKAMGIWFNNSKYRLKDQKHDRQKKTATVK